MIDVNLISQLQLGATDDWHRTPITITRDDFYGLVLENHSYNYQLWHEEDKARRDDMGFEYVYHAKRSIDKFNQMRNNLMQKIDEALTLSLTPDCDANPIHTETPGMIIDRLSILALKHYHMALQVKRSDVDAEHIKTCQHKLTIIELQINTLKTSFKHCLDKIANNQLAFRTYHQFKMYNDASLNPQLYQSDKTNA